MSINHVATRGYGNGTFVGDINLVAVRGYASDQAVVEEPVTGSGVGRLEQHNELTGQGLMDALIEQQPDKPKARPKTAAERRAAERELLSARDKKAAENKAGEQAAVEAREEAEFFADIDQFINDQEDVTELQELSMRLQRQEEFLQHKRQQVAALFLLLAAE